MSEIQAGLARPINVAEMDAILAAYRPQITEAFEQAEVLRNRIQNGERSIADAQAGRIQGLDPEAINRAGTLLESLKLELRKHDFWLTAGLGMALAHGVAELLAETAKEEGWKLPPGSVLRLVLPGLVNVAVDLNS
jgi:hypothetical protein